MRCILPLTSRDRPRSGKARRSQRKTGRLHFFNRGQRLGRILITSFLRGITLMAGRVSVGTSLLVMHLLAVACTSRDSSEDEALQDDKVVRSGPRPGPEVIAGAVDSLAARIIAEKLTPALGVAVVMDGRTILARSYGMADLTNRVPANDNTFWYVSSSSKSLTGFGVSLLAQQGVVDFAAPITTLLPEAKWP